MELELSPSDFAFLWEECKRCYYLKVAKRFPRPRTIMPKIFTQIDLQMKKFYAGKRTEEIDPKMPPGIVEHGEKWVRSEPIRLPGVNSTCVIKGKLDTLVKFKDDDTYGVVDFKTSHRKSEHIALYSRQLHSYAYALEHPAVGAFSAQPISRLGLLVFEPSRYTQSDSGLVEFAGTISWIEIERDDKAFLAFLREVVKLLDSPEPPAPNPNCEWCKYRNRSRSLCL